MRYFEIEQTPKAFANPSPELERSDNSGSALENISFNPERVHSAANPFRVGAEISFTYPELSLRSNSGLELTNAFGVLSIETRCVRSQTPLRL